VYEKEQNVEGTNLKIVTFSGHTVGSIGIQQDNDVFIGDLMMIYILYEPFQSIPALVGLSPQDKY